MEDKKKNNSANDDTKKQQSSETEQSSADRKNESAVHGTPSATERTRANSGDGLANEGTNVSYDQGR